MTDPDWRPLPEAAEAFGLSVDALRKRIARSHGAVTTEKRGTRVFVDVSTIDDAEDAMPRTPDPAMLAAFEERILTLREALRRAEAEAERERKRADAEAERAAERERALLLALDNAWRSVDALTAHALPPPKDNAEDDGTTAGRSLLDRLRGR